MPKFEKRIRSLEVTEICAAKAISERFSRNVELRSRLGKTSEFCQLLDDAASFNYVDTRRTRVNLTLINFRHQHHRKEGNLESASAQIHQPDAHHLFNEPTKCSPQAEEIQLGP